MEVMDIGDGSDGYVYGIECGDDLIGVQVSPISKPQQLNKVVDKKTVPLSSLSNTYNCH